MKRWVLFAVIALCVALAVSPASAWRGEVGWTFKADSAITSGVAVADNLVLVGDATGTLYAVQRASGQLAWSYKGTNSIAGTPSIVKGDGDGRVVFAQENGAVTCLKLADGSFVWRNLPSEDSATTMSDGTAAGGGKVFLVRGDGKLYALGAADGRPLWATGLDQSLRAAPAFDTGSGLVLLGSQNGIFSAIDPETGKRLWGGGAGGAVNTPSASDGHVFFSSWDGSVQSVRVKGVTPQWKANVGDPVTTSPSFGGGKVFVGTARGNIAAIDAKDGQVLWQFDTQGGSVDAQPIFAEGLVFAGDGQGVLSILDAATGKQRFTFKTGRGIVGTPAFEGGVLYLGSGDGSLYAIL